MDSKRFSLTAYIYKTFPNPILGIFRVTEAFFFLQTSTLNPWNPFTTYLWAAVSCQAFKLSVLGARGLAGWGQGRGFDPL